MSYPVVRSQSSNTVNPDTSIVLGKPSGLVVGDLLVAFVGAYVNGGGVVANGAPSGFSAVRQSSSAQSHLSVYAKIADAGDVAASTFTFTVNTSSNILGALVRIDTFVPADPIASSELDETGSAADTEITYSTNIAPDTPESLVIVAFHAGSNNADSMTVSDYSITPTTPLSELIDIQLVDGSNDGHALGVAAGDYAGLTTITSRGAIFTGGPHNEGRESIILIISGPVNAAGTAALLQATAVFPPPAGRADVSGHADLLQGLPTVFVPTGSEDSPTDKWHDEAAPDTDWENEPLP